MSTGVMGIVRPATVSIEDIEIFYTFSPSRENITTGSVNKLNPNDVLTPVKHPNQPNQILGGLYSLKLPAINFNSAGIYNIVIRPKEIFTKIVDCGVLAALPDVKGLILDINREELADFQDKFVDQGLSGYKIEYLNADGSRIPNLFRIITNNGRVEPVTENLDNTTAKAVKYRFSSSGSLVFCQVTPSSAPSVRPGAIPIIGFPNQSIIISNTAVDPIHLEISMVEHTTETLAIGLYGNQVKDLSSGLRTIYDFDNNIYKQFNEFEIKSPDFNNPLFEVRERRKTLDNSQIFSDIIQGI